MISHVSPSKSQTPYQPQPNPHTQNNQHNHNTMFHNKYPNSITIKLKMMELLDLAIQELSLDQEDGGLIVVQNL